MKKVNVIFDSISFFLFGMDLFFSKFFVVIGRKVKDRKVILCTRNVTHDLALVSVGWKKQCENEYLYIVFTFMIKEKNPFLQSNNFIYVNITQKGNNWKPVQDKFDNFQQLFERKKRPWVIFSHCLMQLFKNISHNLQQDKCFFVIS